MNNDVQRSCYGITGACTWKIIFFPETVATHGEDSLLVRVNGSQLTGDGADVAASVLSHQNVAAEIQHISYNLSMSNETSNKTQQNYVEPSIEQNTTCRSKHRTKHTLALRHHQSNKTQAFTRKQIQMSNKQRTKQTNKQVKQKKTNYPSRKP